MKARFVSGNRVSLLENGVAYFPALREAIDNARRELYLETYIFEDDDTGRLITDALRRAARRGVSVRVMVDGFGAPEFPRKLMPRLLEAGAEVLVYRPEIARLSVRRHRLRRLHRKIAVIDSAVAFVGGINIVDDTAAPSHTAPRYDYAVRVEGPLLGPIHQSSKRLWELVAWANFKRRYRVSSQPPGVAAPRGGVRAAFVIRDNLRHRRDIENAYLDAINSATREIILANAYFLPGRRFRRALYEAASRGVEVTILLQGRVEYFLLHYATQALYGSLLAARVRIFEYHRSFLHAKVAVVDRRWSTVGSSNIDPFSLLLAREANVVVTDEGFAALLHDRLHAAMREGAAELKPEAWKRKSLLHRARHWLAYALVRLLIGLAGYGAKH